MNVDTMRFIDLRCGVPLTWIATWLVKLSSVFVPSGKTKSRNILFLELSEMGSAILVDPAMRKAREAFGAELFFCVFSKNRESLFLLRTVDERNIFVIREDNLAHLLTDTMKFFTWTREKNIDTVIDLELFSRFTALLTGLSGAKRRVGFFAFHNEGLYRGDMLTHKVAYNPHIHIAKNFIALVNALLSDNGEIPYSKTAVTDKEIALTKVSPGDGEKDRVWKKVKEQYPSLDKGAHHIVLMNPNASQLLPQRRWPLAKYAGLIGMVLGYDARAVVLITGSPAEYDEMQALVNGVYNPRCVNFSGKVEFAELPALYSLATLMVTNDSGPAHFSSITDMPTFILYGPETPKLYGSLGNAFPLYAGLACSPCVTAANHRKTPCRDNVCLQVISEKEVFDAIKPLLKTKAGK